MKEFVLVAVMASSLVSGQAIAACENNTRLSGPAIRALLGGNTVCVPAVTVPTMTWQELHVGTSASTTGPLVDFKRGPPPGETVDPSKTVGTWTVDGQGNSPGTVAHNYGSGGSYTYTVHGSGVVGTNHSFCVGATEIVARVKLGGGAC